MSAPKTITHLLPTGAIILWGGADMPSGFLLCNGASVSRSDYPDLADALGETGDTFSLPDYRDRVPQGAGTVSPNVGVEASLPNMKGCFQTRPLRNVDTEVVASFFGLDPHDDYVALFDASVSEDLPANNAITVNYAGEYFPLWNYNFTADNLNSLYSNAGAVQPPAWTTHFLIKA